MHEGGPELSLTMHVHLLNPRTEIKTMLRREDLTFMMCVRTEDGLYFGVTAVLVLARAWETQA